MPRVRAADYEDKMQGIADVSARLFAKSGYPGVRMTEIAEACNVSKAMVYHYFPTKDDILFFIIKEYLDQVVETLEEVAADDKASPRDKLSEFVNDFIQRSTKMRSRNLVAMNDVVYLSETKRKEAGVLQRRIVELLAALVARVNPNAPKRLLRPYALFLMGTLNWSDKWYRADGEIKPDEMAELISQAYQFGIMR